MLIFLSKHSPFYVQICIKNNLTGSNITKYRLTYFCNGFIIYTFFLSIEQWNRNTAMLVVFMQGDVCACKLAPTGIFPSFISVDKAGNQHDECKESDGTHQADKPALSWYSSMDAGQTWGEQIWWLWHILAFSLGHLIECLQIDKTHLMQNSGWQGTLLMETVQY